MSEHLCNDDWVLSSTSPNVKLKSFKILYSGLKLFFLHPNLICCPVFVIFPLKLMIWNESNVPTHLVKQITLRC